MKKSSCLANLHFCEAAGLEPACLPVPLPLRAFLGAAWLAKASARLSALSN